MTKKLLAILISVILVVSCMMVPAMAVDGEEEFVVTEIQENTTMFTIVFNKAVSSDKANLAKITVTSTIGSSPSVAIHTDTVDSVKVPDSTKVDIKGAAGTVTITIASDFTDETGEQTLGTTYTKTYTNMPAFGVKGNSTKFNGTAADVTNRKVSGCYYVTAGYANTPKGTIIVALYDGDKLIKSASGSPKWYAYQSAVDIYLDEGETFTEAKMFIWILDNNGNWYPVLKEPITKTAAELGFKFDTATE